MGAPKQKWNSAEEAALKAGVAKYGAGKWSTILKDAAYSSILRLRSNVDLKDKWRNLHVFPGRSGSRPKSRATPRNSQLVLKNDDKSPSIEVEENTETVQAKPLTICDESPEVSAPKAPSSSWDNLIMEAINKLKEPRGSSRANIAAYIEEHYPAPPDLEKLLNPSLKLLTETGKLIKVKHQYRIAPAQQTFEAKEEPETPLLPEGRQDSPRLVEPKPTRVFTRAIVDEELAQMKSMTSMEAAAAAAQAVAEAEAAIAAAEVAAKEAEDAERDAELAHAFAEAAMKALNSEPHKFGLKIY